MSDLEIFQPENGDVDMEFSLHRVGNVLHLAVASYDRTSGHRIGKPLISVQGSTVDEVFQKAAEAAQG